MSPRADQAYRDRRARRLSHTARKNSRQLRRVAFYLRAHDRLLTQPDSSTVSGRIGEQRRQAQV